jgi:hypothetical protein
MAKTPNILYTETGVSVDRCFIITGTGNRIELGLQMLELNVYEDIFAPTISATLLMEDALNLIEALPICGQEWMFISVSKPGFEDKNGDDISFQLVLRIYKIERVSMDGQFKQVYLMHLTEEDAIVNETERVCKSYQGLPESAIRDIFINSFGYDSDLFKEAFDGDMQQSLNTVSFVIPNLKPLQAVSYISTLAQNNGVHDFLFFENNAGYRFASLSTLFQQDPISIVRYRIKQLSSSNLGPNDPYVNSLSPIEFENTVLFDYLKGLAQGEYGIQSSYLNLTKQKYIENPMSYNKFLSKKKVLNEFGKVPPNDWNELPKDNEPQVMHRVFSVRPDMNTNAQKAYALDAQRMQTRLMQFASITNQRIKLNMPGSAAYKAGSVIQLEYPSISSKSVGDGRDELLDKYLSGKYIISSIRHVITRKEWNSYLEISKDTLGNELAPQFAQNFTLQGL